MSRHLNNLLLARLDEATMSALICRARKLPVGPSRNDLRQLAIGLRWLDKKGLALKVEARLKGPSANNRSVELMSDYQHADDLLETRARRDDPPL